MADLSITYFIIMEDFKFYRFINDKSILVISPKGLLKRLYCPFPVMDANRKLMQVDSVGSGNDNSIFYQVNVQFRPYSLFRIVSI